MASELWGLDISTKQLENAEKYLHECGYTPKLFNSPMEEDPGLPKKYFDFAYSIYAIGWTTDLPTTFKLIASYLKKDGIFIFSWDHPFMHCIEPQEGKLIFEGCYLEEDLFHFTKGNKKMSLYNRKISTYINALAESGFMVERMVEETDSDTLKREFAFESSYYSPNKAKKFPLSFILKQENCK